jgi:toxin ParE1/3/4
MHLRGARGRAAEEVRQPVHVIYFRTVAADMIEIIRVLHERMEPARHLRGKPPSKLP